MYVAIDYGTKNIGIALSDKKGIIAKSYSIIKNDNNFRNYLYNLCNKHKVRKIIVGVPLDIDGNDTKLSSKIRVEFLFLENDFDVIYWNETLSSKEAENILRLKGKKRGKVDDIAAQIILQEYLNFLNDEN